MVLAIPRHNLNFSAGEILSVIGSIFKKPACTKITKGFEKEFARYLGISGCISFSSGSAALFHGLQNCGLGRGDKIILPDYEFISVVETVRMCGLVPVFARTDPATGNLAVDAIERAFDPDVKAVLVAHIHGQPADIEPIVNWCQKQNVTLIEDCAHAAGAAVRNRKAGCFGRFSIFSFGPGKSLTTCGGGIVATDDETLLGKLRDIQAGQPLPDKPYERKRMISALLNWFFSTRLVFTIIIFPILYLGIVVTGKNPLDKALLPISRIRDHPPKDYDYRFCDSAATLGMSQLIRLDSLNEKRLRNVEQIAKHLRGAAGVEPFRFDKDNENIFLNFAVRVPGGDTFSTSMFKQGVDVRRDYLQYFSTDFPNGQIPKGTIFIPNHPGICEKEAPRIAQATKQAIKNT